MSTKTLHRKERHVQVAAKTPLQKLQYLQKGAAFSSLRLRVVTTPRMAEVRGEEKFGVYDV